MAIKDHSFSIILLSTAIALVGLLFKPYLSLNLNPDYQYPSLTVSTTYGNASPEEVERQITGPIESIIATLPGITKMYSRSYQGSSAITLSIDKRVDMEIFKFQVLTLLRQIHRNLPEQAGLPVVTTNKPGEEKNMTQILTYSIYAPMSSEAI